ncbi:MAG: carboxypeptidase regulatory-like domain-containing protein [Balneolaceae bacterium]|nr:MAG: carboxypeptidase regulatory-like domain-containing protein [Balneolaceae bacterium]
MRNRTSRAVLALLVPFIIISCSKETVMTEVFGDIEGSVIHSKTDEPIRNVSISTSPGTVAILTEEDGTFYIEDVPTGNYNIQARKDGFSNTSVSVAVREDRIATAQLVMKPVEEDTSASKGDLEAEVTNWFNRAEGDTTFVDVEFSVANIGASVTIEEYEVYFEILTGGDSFFYDISGEELKAGQRRFGQFTKNIFNNTATDVVVLDTWVSE